MKARKRLGAEILNDMFNGDGDFFDGKRCEDKLVVRSVIYANPRGRPKAETKLRFRVRAILPQGKDAGRAGIKRHSTIFAVKSDGLQANR
jgi:hypothetical protein